MLRNPDNRDLYEDIHSKLMVQLFPERVEKGTPDTAAKEDAATEESAAEESA